VSGKHNGPQPRLAPQHTAALLAQSPPSTRVYDLHQRLRPPSRTRLLVTSIVGRACSIGGRPRQTVRPGPWKTTCRSGTRVRDRPASPPLVIPEMSNAVMPMSLRQPFTIVRARGISVASASPIRPRFPGPRCPIRFDTARTSATGVRPGRRRIYTVPSIALATDRPRDNWREQPRSRFGRSVAVFTVSTSPLTTSAQYRHLASGSPAPPQQTPSSRAKLPQPTEALPPTRRRGPRPTIRFGHDAILPLPARLRESPADPGADDHRTNAHPALTRDKRSPPSPVGPRSCSSPYLRPPTSGGRSSSSDNPYIHFPTAARSASTAVTIRIRRAVSRSADGAYCGAWTAQESAPAVTTCLRAHVGQRLDGEDRHDASRPPPNAHSEHPRGGNRHSRAPPITPR